MQIKITMLSFKSQIYYLPKVVIKNCNVTIVRKNIYNSAIDSVVKLYEEIRKLSTGQGECYSTG